MHRLTALYRKPLGPGKWHKRWCVYSQVGHVYMVPTYLAVRMETAVYHPIFSSYRYVNIHTGGAFSYSGIAWTFPNDYFFNFSVGCSCSLRTVTVQNIHITRSSHKHSCSQVNWNNFFQFESLRCLKSVADYSLCGDNALFLSLWKLRVKPAHFFSWAIQFEWFIVSTFPYASMNEQIQIQESLWLVFIWVSLKVIFFNFCDIQKYFINTTQ